MRKEILVVLLLFLTAQTIGLFVGKTLTEQAKVYSEFKNLNIAPAGEDRAESSALFLLYVLLGAALLLLVMKFYKGILLFKLIEAGMIFVASNVVFYVILLTLNIPYYLELSVLLSGALAIAKFLSAQLKNVSAVIASAGVGAIFGFSLDPLPAILFILGLSLYDIWAVYGTKHMVTMARELGGRNLAFSINAESYEKVMVKVKPTAAEKRKKGKKAKPKYEERWRKSSLELGTGDIAIPLMLAVSAFKTGSVIAPVAIVLASTAALYGVLWYVLERREFLPALPPLAGAGTATFIFVRLVGL